MSSVRFAAMAGMVGLLACGGGYGGGDGASYPTTPPGSGGGATILILDTSFQPDSTNVPVGGTITFTNNGYGEHNVTFSSNPPSEGNIPDHIVGSFPRTFPNAGRTAYTCSRHPQVSGVIRVQ